MSEGSPGVARHVNTTTSIPITQAGGVWVSYWGSIQRPAGRAMLIGMEQLLSIKSVMARLDVSRTTLLRARKNCRGFPEPIKVGTAQRWRAADIDAWIAAQARQNGSGPSEG